jgi:zinc D-Ala-D-Ala dipeptidase
MRFITLPIRMTPGITLTCCLLLMLSGCKNGVPKEKGPFRNPDLVEVATLDSTIHLDIRYATSNNFTGHAVYRQAKCILQRPAAEALVRVNGKLRDIGYGILVFDGYRPWSVTKIFWETASEKEREKGFVANPAKGSKHNRGCAIDLTLYDLATGKEVDMPSQYDEFTDRAGSKYSGGSSESMRLREILRVTMASEGFNVVNEEWWHFDYKDWQSYPILNIPFEDL